jgi:ferredoxin
MSRNADCLDCSRKSFSQEKIMKIIVDWSLCDGNGLCALQAPELLELDDNDHLSLLQERFDEKLLGKAEAAVKACPKCALSIAYDE